MSKPSKTAMEAAVRISLELDSRNNEMDDVIAAKIIDQVMQSERDAAERLRIVADALVHAPLREHLSIQFPELAKARMELIQALAAHEAAKGK